MSDIPPTDPTSDPTTGIGPWYSLEGEFPDDNPYESPRDDERRHALIRVALMLAAELADNDIDRLVWRLERAKTPHAAADLAALRWLTNRGDSAS